MKVGDYVRIKDGTYTCIGKIKRFERTNCLHIIIDYSNNEDFNESDWFEWNIIKSAEGTPKGLLSLIQVGDYVNGVEVENIDDEWITMSDTKVPILKSIANGLIKSIVTKEQFSQMEYKVGE